MKRINNFLKWFGLSSIAITLVYVLFLVLLPDTFHVFPNHPYAVGDFVGILCTIGAACAVWGLLQYDSGHPLYGVFSICKYTGFICWISAPLAMSFGSEAEMRSGIALAYVGLGAFALCILCAVIGRDVRKRG